MVLRYLFVFLAAALSIHALLAPWGVWKKGPNWARSGNWVFAAPLWWYLFTYLLWGWTGELNNAGTNWFNDLWNPIWHGPHLMEWWAIVVYLISLFVWVAKRFFSDTTGRIVATLGMVFVTLSGMASVDWEDLSPTTGFESLEPNPECKHEGRGLIVCSFTPLRKLAEDESIGNLAHYNLTISAEDTPDLHLDADAKEAKFERIRKNGTYKVTMWGTNGDNVETLRKTVEVKVYGLRTTSSGRSATTSTSASPTPTQAPIDVEDVDQQVQDKAPDFADEDIIVTEAPDLSQDVERGSSWFCEGVYSRSEISECLNGPDERSAAAMIHINGCLSDQGYSEEVRKQEIERARSGEGYIAAQFKVDARIRGNTWFEGGEAVSDDEWRQIEAGDIFWLFVDQQGRVVWCASLRADCANPDLVDFEPAEGRPSAPPIERTSVSSSSSSQATTSASRSSSAATTTAPATSSSSSSSVPTTPGKNASETSSAGGIPVVTAPPARTSTSSSSSSQSTASTTYSEVESPVPAESSAASTSAGSGSTCTDDTGSGC